MLQPRLAVIPANEGYETYLNFWIPDPGYVDLSGIPGITMNFCCTLCFRNHISSLEMLARAPPSSPHCAAYRRASSFIANPT
jgi:hypothetical protein